MKNPIKDKLMYVRVDAELRDWIVKEAEKDGRTISGWIARKLWEWRELSREDEVVSTQQIGLTPGQLERLRGLCNEKK